MAAQLAVKNTAAKNDPPSGTRFGLLPQPGGFEGVSAEAESTQCSRQRRVVLQGQDALLSQRAANPAAA